MRTVNGVTPTRLIIVLASGCSVITAGPVDVFPSDARNAARFILQCQNPDGGFGSYEAQRSRVGLEWLNPAEMFGDSMTEHSYVECTASCITALATFRRRFPNYLGAEIEPAIAAFAALFDSST